MVSRLLFGLNHRFCFDGFGTYDRVADQVDARFTSALRRSGVTATRFPGGTVANTYRWQLGIGPPEQRRPHPHGRSGTPVTGEYGTDEHLRFAEDLAIPTTIVVNFATGTAAEAAAWVEYLNAPADGSSDLAMLRAAHGHPEPYGIRYFEVANEPHLPRQRYWLGPGTADEIAHKYAFGGTTRFTDQPVGTLEDHRDSAAVSDGRPGQTFAVRFPPVVPGTQQLRVDGSLWLRVADLGAHGAEAVYAFDPSTGEIRFGDGTHGAVPPLGSRITMSYDSGPHDGFVDFYRAMKAVDPTIRVCTSLESERLIELLGAEHPYDGYVVHQYCGAMFPRDDPRVTDPAAVHDAVMRQPAEMGAAIARVRELIDGHAGARAAEVEIPVTEYGMLFLPFEHPVPSPHYLASLDQALYVACSLAEYAEQGVTLALKHTAVDLPPDAETEGADSLGPADQAVLGPPPDYLPSATAHLFAMLTAATGAHLVSSAVHDDHVRTLDDGTELAALRTLATLDDDTLHLWVVNRDREEHATAHVQVEGVELGDRARLRALTGARYTTVNTPDAPDAVSVTESELDVDPTNLVLCFPAHSVTVISVPRA